MNFDILLVGNVSGALSDPERGWPKLWYSHGKKY